MTKPLFVIWVRTPSRRWEPMPALDEDLAFAIARVLDDHGRSFKVVPAGAEEGQPCT